VTDDFRALLQAFIRRFGLLAGDQTPCGKPLPPSDAHALMCLLESGEDGLPQNAIAARLGVDKSTASRLVSRLVERGHATDATSEDARARPIRLTRSGVRVAKEVETASRRRFGAVLEAIPARRRAEVVQALREIVAALDRVADTRGEEQR
jgi:DNA-binding MarR family transcriptional regulator